VNDRTRRSERYKAMSAQVDALEVDLAKKVAEEPIRFIAT